MKIALVSDLFPPYVLGGAERRYYNLAIQLSRRHDVHVYTMLIEGSKRTEKIGRLTVHRLGMPHPLRKRAFLPMLVYLAALIRELPGKDYDVIDCNAYFSAIGGYAASKANGTPIVATIHDVYAQKWPSFMGSTIAGAVGWSMEILLAKLGFNKVVTVSRSSASLLSGVYKMNKERLCVIPNGADEEFHEDTKAKRDMHRILYVGRLVPLKNVDELIQAFGIAAGKNPKLTLEIIGEGPLRGELEQSCRRMGIENKVTFAGTIATHKEVAERMRTCGMLATASIREGFGLTLIEAMACGTPVAAYGLNAYEEFRGNHNPLLVERGNARQLAEAMLTITGNRSAWEKMSGEGIRISKCFTWEKAAEKLENAYMEIIQ